MYLAEKQVDPDTLKTAVIQATPVPVIGLSIGIPIIDGKEPQTFTYKINVVKSRELFGVDGDDFEEIDETITEDAT